MVTEYLKVWLNPYEKGEDEEERMVGALFATACGPEWMETGARLDEFTQAEIAAAIERLDVRKGPGPDRVKPETEGAT